MSRGAQFSDIRPAAAFNGVAPPFDDDTGSGAPFYGLVIPPTDGMQVGQQVYLVIDVSAVVEDPLPGNAAYYVAVRPLWLRPQTQFRSIGYNWNGPGNRGKITYASNVYQLGAEQGADGKSFGVPTDSPTLAGRLSEWLGYEPLWLSSVRRLDSTPSSPGPTPPASPPGNSFSTLLDDEWVFPLTGRTGETTIRGRKAFYVPAAGVALQFASSITMPETFVPDQYPGIPKESGIRAGVQYKIGETNSVFQQDVD